VGKKSTVGGDFSTRSAITPPHLRAVVTWQNHAEIKPRHDNRRERHLDTTCWSHTHRVALHHNDRLPCSNTDDASQLSKVMVGAQLPSLQRCTSIKCQRRSMRWTLYWWVLPQHRNTRMTAAKSKKDAVAHAPRPAVAHILQPQEADTPNTAQVHCQPQPEPAGVVLLEHNTQKRQNPLRSYTLRHRINACL
jgi:hypothetical protein